MDLVETRFALNQMLEQIAALEQQGRTGEAEAAYRQILSQDQNSAVAWHGLGLLILNKGDLKLAAEMVMKAVTIDPRQGIYQRNFGEMCRRLGMLEQAIVSGKAAVTLLPKDLDAHFNLALAYSDSGDFKNAIAFYRKALKINPQHGQSWNNLGAAFEASGHMADAMSFKLALHVLGVQLQDKNLLDRMKEDAVLAFNIDEFDKNVLDLMNFLDLELKK